MKVEELGFYYMVFQPYPPKGRVKAWLDGEAAAKYYNYEDLIKLVPYNMHPIMRKAFMEYSLFLWDVTGGMVRRLSSKGEKIPIGEWIKNKKTEGAIEEPKTIEDSYWKTAQEGDSLTVEK